MVKVTDNIKYIGVNDKDLDLLKVSTLSRTVLRTTLM